jgi:hypothetical protein
MNKNIQRYSYNTFGPWFYHPDINRGWKIIMSRFWSDRRRGIGLSTGFIVPYNQLQHD